MNIFFLDFAPADTWVFLLLDILNATSSLIRTSSCVRLFFTAPFPFIPHYLPILRSHSFIKNSSTEGGRHVFVVSDQLVAQTCWLWPLSGAQSVESACVSSLALATDCGPTPAHTLLANEASPQQKAAVNYRRLRRTDELSCDLRARLLIQLFKVDSRRQMDTSITKVL